MNKLELIETLSQILNRLSFAMDEVDNVNLLKASMELESLIDQLDNEAHTEGVKSGAI